MAKAVAARPYTSAAGADVCPAASSGATYPWVPPWWRDLAVPPVMDRPKSTTATRPSGARIRLLGLTSWCTIEGRCPWRWSRASAAWLTYSTTSGSGSPGDPRSWRTRARLTPSTQSMAMKYRSPTKKSSRTIGSLGCGRRVSRTRASRRIARRSRSDSTVRIFRATTRSCWWSSARTTSPWPPRPTTSRSSYRSRMRDVFITRHPLPSWWCQEFGATPAGYARVVCWTRRFPPSTSFSVTPRATCWSLFPLCFIVQISPPEPSMHESMAATVCLHNEPSPAGAPVSQLHPPHLVAVKERDPQGPEPDVHVSSLGRQPERPHDLGTPAVDEEQAVRDRPHPELLVDAPRQNARPGADVDGCNYLVRARVHAEDPILPVGHPHRAVRERHIRLIAVAPDAKSIDHLIGCGIHLEQDAAVEDPQVLPAECQPPGAAEPNRGYDLVRSNVDASRDQL